MSDSYFSPDAVELYLRLVGRTSVEETARVILPPKASELELQARFHAGEFGETWTTLCGREVRLLNPGEWNREAGPDFRRAMVLFDGELRQTGDIEIDIESAGWETHGHAINPGFNDVVLHCFFREGRRRCFARTLDHRAVPQVRLGPLPNPVPTPQPSDQPVAPFLPEPVSSPAAALHLVCLAAHHRLQQKARTLERARRLHGPRAALWQALATALGYRRNSIPLALLAQRVPPRRASGEDGEALLFGLAGFLEDRPQGMPAPESKSYWHSLWEHWWKLRHAESRLILPPTAWQRTGARPANHPHRRVAALAALARPLERLARALEEGEEKIFRHLLADLTHPFWDHHWHLDGRVLVSEHPGDRADRLGRVALLGANRINDILINVWCPWRAIGGGADFEAALSRWNTLLPGQIPRKVRDLAAWLHPDLESSPADLRCAATQQGLLQLGQDFFGVESPRHLEERLLSV